MASKTIVTIVCDLCGTDKNVETHEIALDQKAPRVVDACPGCWTPVGDVLENVMSAGTSKKIADRRAVASRSSRSIVTTPAVEKPTARTTPKKASAKKAAPKNSAPKRTSKKASATNTRTRKSTRTPAESETT